MKNLTSKKISLSIAALTLSVLSIGVASAHPVEKEGYLIDTRGVVVRNAYNECWRTGYWTPAMAIAECDPDLVKKETPVTPPAKTEIQNPPPAAIKTITLQAETLFDFDKSVVRPDGKKILDTEVVAKMKQYPEVEVVLVSGYADRIGKDAYNQKLSERRAAAVKSYMVQQGVAASRIETTGMGEADPVVACSDVKGKESARNKKLVACLQPNRRVVVQVKVQAPAK